MNTPDIRDLYIARIERNKDRRQAVLLLLFAIVSITVAVIITH